MTDSLRDQLLKLGIAKKPEPATRSAPPSKSLRSQTATAGPSRTATEKHGGHASAKSERNRPVASRPPVPATVTSSSREEMDLAKAYALRERHEREEQRALRQAAEAKAAARRADKIKLRELTLGKTLNDANADQARHFPHADKIKRIYVNADQLTLLNTGHLGVVAIEGRYLLVDREVALAVAQVRAEALVLLPEPGANEEDEWPPSSSPQAM